MKVLIFQNVIDVKDQLTFKVVSDNRLSLSSEVRSGTSIKRRGEVKKKCGGGVVPTYPVKSFLGMV